MLYYTLRNRPEHGDRMCHRVYKSYRRKMVVKQIKGFSRGLYKYFTIAYNSNEESFSSAFLAAYIIFIGGPLFL